MKTLICALGALSFFSVLAYASHQEEARPERAAKVVRPGEPTFVKRLGGKARACLSLCPTDDAGNWLPCRSCSDLRE